MSHVRYVHPVLQASLNSRVTTLCMLLKIVPVDGPVVGLCSTNRKVVYDDLLDEVTYVSRHGFDPSAVAFSAGTQVDNSEANVLFGAGDSLVLGITEEMIDSGYLDEASYILYLVDYLDLTAGRHAEIESGKLGDIIKRGQAAKVECRSRTQQLAQAAVCETGSITCRAFHGDASTGCGDDVDSMWVSGSVSGSPIEVDRMFDTNLAAAAGTYQPGLLEWLDGDNAGRSYEVETHETGGLISLAHPTYYDIANGDTFRIRWMCPKTKAACISRGQINNFRGEPDTPEGDSRTNQTPRILSE